MRIPTQLVYNIAMKTTERKKRGAAAIFALCPRRTALLLAAALVVLLHLATRRNYALNRALSEHAVRPLHRFLSRINDVLPFSLAELLIGLAAAALLVYIIYTIVCLIVRKGRGVRLYRFLVTLAAAGMSVYALFCLLWGVFYYGDDFMARSGLPAEKISTAQLATVTRYFAALANETAPQLPRDERGVCASDREEILARSAELYAHLEQVYPFLEGPEVHAKGVFFSRVMSYTDFTGFFFPFTAEANVNTDSPACYFASTVAHELAHQRGVAQEQQANFVAVLASLDYNEADYVYSAALLAYTHLSNALYRADPAAWQEVYSTLSTPVLQDLKENRDYWQSFRTPVRAVSNTVYEGFLQSYDQQLGLKSYGACVDLLVNYYYEIAAASLPEPVPKPPLR